MWAKSCVWGSCGGAYRTRLHCSGIGSCLTATWGVASNPSRARPYYGLGGCRWGPFWVGLAGCAGRARVVVVGSCLGLLSRRAPGGKARGAHAASGHHYAVFTAALGFCPHTMSYHTAFTFVRGSFMHKQLSVLSPRSCALVWSFASNPSRARPYYTTHLTTCSHASCTGELHWQEAGAQCTEY